MARIRTLKPEFWTDEKLAPLSPIDRLVFVGLISQADDAGRLVDNLRLIDGLLFPCTKDSAEKSLAKLEDLKRIFRYESESGQPLIQICGWEKHQKVDHPSTYALPPPNDERLQTFRSISRESRESLDTNSRESRASINDQRPTTNDQRSSSSASSDALRVFEFWKATCQKNGRVKFDATRKSKVTARLKDFDVDALCKAVEGYWNDPDWDRKLDLKRHDLELVCRNVRNVEAGLERYEKWKGNGGGRPEAFKPTPQVPDGHPCAGHKEGEKWKDEEGVQHAIRDGWYWKKPVDGEPHRVEKVL